MQNRTLKRGFCYSSPGPLLSETCVVVNAEVKSGLNTDFCPSVLHTSLCCCKITMEGSRWREQGLGGLCLPPTKITKCSRRLLPTHPRSFARAVAATQPIWAAGWHSPRSPERCRRGNSRSLSGRGARCGPAPGGQLSLLGGGGGGCAPLCGQRRAASIAARRVRVRSPGAPAASGEPAPAPLNTAGQVCLFLIPSSSHKSTVCGRRAPAAARPAPESPPISLPSRSLSLFPSRFKLSPRRKQHSGAARPAFHRPGAAAAGALKTKRRTVTFHTVPFPPRAE